MVVCRYFVDVQIFIATDRKLGVKIGLLLKQLRASESSHISIDTYRDL